jgi:hypothetical protein
MGRKSTAIAVALLAVTAAPPMLTPAPALAQARPAALTNGEWEGEQSRNRVTIQNRAEGIWVSPVTQHAGQTENGFLYRSSSDGTYQFRFPDGNVSVVTVLGPDRLRLRNPDGWTDDFRLIRRF